MLQLDLVLMEETTEKVRRRDPKPTLVEVSERHHFPRLWMRHYLIGGGSPSGNLLWWKKTLRHKALQLCLRH